MKRPVFVPACLLVLAACSSNPEPAATPAPTPQPAQAVTPAPTRPSTGAFDPVGDYTFTVDVMGQSQSGTLSIVKGADGKLTGKLMGPPDEPALDITGVTVVGNKMTFGATIPNGPEIGFVLNFEGNDKFAGTVTLPGMDGGKITGERKKG